MKKILLPVSLMSFFLLTANAMAADGTINFTGTITDSACKIDTTSSTQTVNLGTVSSTAFGSVGATASPTKFSIVLSSCPASAKTASVKFDGASDMANSDLLALGSGSTASGVGIGIYESDSTTRIPLATASTAYNLSATETNTLNFIAKYVATAVTVKAGTANSVSDFTIMYN